MSVLGNSLLLGAEAAGPTAYQVSRSLRFNAGDSAYISRVVSSAGNRKTFTLSWWMKKSGLTIFQSLFNSFTDSNNRFAINFDSSIGAGGAGDYLTMFNGNAGAFNNIFQTNALFRDASAWYHIVIAIDTTQASSSERVKLWVNGTLQTFSSYTAPSQNADLNWNSATTHYFGVYGGSPSTTAYGFNGYLAEVHHIDGSALTPSSFAETDATTGQWIPKLFSGSYGSQGWKLTFSDNSAATATTLGKDTSGNSPANNWTPNNFQVSSTPTYSNYLTNSYTLTDAASAFDGSTATYAQDWNGVYNANYNYEIVFTPPTPISFTSQVRVFGPGGPQSPYSNRYAINLGSGFGSDVSSVQNGWATVATGSGSITAIRSRSNQNGCFIGAIEIDGVILVQSPGSAVDSLVDTPTSYGTDARNGGEVRGNYCTWNPLDQSGITFSNGNLDTTGGGICRATFGLASGKWYWEQTVITKSDGANNPRGGVATGSASLTNDLGAAATQWVMFMAGGSNGGKGYNASTITGSGSAFSVNDVAMFAYDADAGKLWFGRNGTWITGDPAAGTSPFYSSVTAPVFPVAQEGSSSSVVNYGQRAFSYQAPSGFKALVDTNLPSPSVAKPSTVMDVKLYTGNGSSQTISGLGFSPDLVWIKERSGTGAGDAWHALFDSVRGNTKALYSNDTNAETTGTAFTSFDSLGFTVGLDTSQARTNDNNDAYVAWAWDAGTSTVTNTQGSITSSVRANASAGFSVVTWTANNGAATIGHGLGVAPEFIIVKDRDTSTFWQVYHKSMGNTNAMSLNSTNAASAGSGNWNNTSPTSTVFSVGVSSNYLTDKHVAYCFAPVAGYSSFGSYTGNGSTDGPFVYTGFRPKFILGKVSSTTDGWYIFDAARSPYNVTDKYFAANASAAEATFTFADFLSNGFKLRATTSDWNASGQTYIYAAFAENPFQYARAR